MSALTDFLLARIAEDEAVARAATPGVWIAGMESSDSLASRPMVAAGGQRDETHIVRWNPARVLAECAAKRAIIAEHPIDMDAIEPGCRTCDSDSENDVWGNGPCATLRALAQPYADRPDFREEWRARWMRHPRPERVCTSPPPDLSWSAPQPTAPRSLPASNTA